MVQSEDSQRHGGVTRADESQRVNETSFSFDHVYDAQSSNQQIFEEVLQPGVAKCLEGYNFTVFCYGQTGTGETPRCERNAIRVTGGFA